MSTEPSPLSASSTPTAVTDATGASPAADATAPSRPVERPTPPAEAPMAGRRQQARKADGQRADARAGRDRRRRPPARGKRKVRKVHRVVRHIEVWSLAKLATIFVACGYVVAMVAGYLLWRAADRVGTIEGIEGFMEDSGGYDSFQILGDVVFRAAALIGLVLAAVTVAVVVLGAVLFNLISDLTGGIRMTVIDEDLVVAPARRPAPGPSRPSGSPAAPSSPPAARGDGTSSSG